MRSNVDEFLKYLVEYWLPAGTRMQRLLYHGSVAEYNLTAGAFHRLCDNKGPTLVLVRSSCGLVFGGYAPVAWDSSGGAGGHTIPAPEAFLFTLAGFHEKIARYPAATVGCNAFLGPCIEGLELRAGALSATDTFNQCSLLALPGMKPRSFTPEVIEVFGVNDDARRGLVARVAACASDARQAREQWALLHAAALDRAALLTRARAQQVLAHHRCGGPGPTVRVPPLSYNTRLYVMTLSSPPPGSRV